MADPIPFPSRRRFIPPAQRDRCQRLADKLQRLVLEHPAEAEEVEKLIDRLLAKHAPKD